jgi:serine protease Do
MTGTVGQGSVARRATWLLALLALLAACDGRGKAPADRGSPGAIPPPPPAAVPPPPLQGQVTPRAKTPTAARVLSEAFTTVATAVRPSVVRIDVEHLAPRVSGVRGGTDRSPFGGAPPSFRHFFDFGGPELPEPPSPAPIVGTGSGFVLDATGVLLTNSHVVEGGSKFKVTFFDGQEIPARVIGKDRRTDVAVVRLAHNPKGLTAARLGNSNLLQVGEWVLAVGSPLGLDQTVTVGIISGKGRVGGKMRMSGDRVREYVQTDAKINPGNSGGPLVNLDGEVIGINTLIRVGAGGAYGFAVPVNEAYRVARLLLKDGRIRYPYLGVNLRDLSDLSEELKQHLGGKLPAKGALVIAVTPGSPAAKVGLQQGDIITRLDNTVVNNADDVVAYITNHKIGDPIKVSAVRGSDTKSFRTVLAEAPSEEEAEEETSKLGLTLQTLTPGLAQSLGLPPDLRGALVADVVRDGPAARAGLAPGDVILEIDQKAVSTAEDAGAALRSGKRHILRVRGPLGYRFILLGS